MDNRYNGVQALRFVAALLVVIMHVGLYATERLKFSSHSQIWEAGNSGVDIFFVISGFVITISSRDLLHTAGGWKEFLLRRVIRIVPLYWLLTTLKLLAAAVVPAIAVHSQPNFIHIVSSYLFLPARSTEGTIFPYLGVGWTLNFEFLFYLIFAIGLFINANIFKFCVTVLIPVAAVSLVRTSGWPAISFYADPIVIEFLLGMLLAESVGRGKKFDARLAALVAAAGLLLITTSPEFLSSSPRLLKWGVPALLVVSGVVYMEPLVGHAVPKWLVTLGNSSYALYLTHPFTGPLLIILLGKSGLFSPPSAQMISIITAVGVSVLVYIFVDGPIYRYLTGLKKRRQKAVVEAHGEHTS